MVVDVVEGHARKAGDAYSFPGLYLSQMADQPFVGACVIMIRACEVCEFGAPYLFTHDQLFALLNQRPFLS